MLSQPKINIKVLDGVECEVSSGEAILFSHALEYPNVYYRPQDRSKGQYSKQRISDTASAFSYSKGPVWRFWTGLLPRVINTCKEAQYDLTIKDAQNWLKDRGKIRKPAVEGITFRESQLKALKALVKAGRGVCVAPTAYGKTIVIMGLSSIYYDHKILVLCHTKSIINQTYAKFKEYEFAGVRKFHGDVKNNGFGRINIATKQTIANMVKAGDIEPDEFDVIIIDEVHKLSGFGRKWDRKKQTHYNSGQYVDILSHLMAPIRYGFTGTYPRPEELEKHLCIESYVGPKVYEMTKEEAIEKGIISQPCIKIVQEREVQEHKRLTWMECQRRAIIDNEEHNIMVAQEAITEMDDGRTVLIFVNTVDHMMNISNIIIDAAPDLTVKNVHSSVGKEMQTKLDVCEMNIRNAKFRSDLEQYKQERSELKETIKRLKANTKKQEKYRQWLIDKKINGVIATSTWREGIDIPSLDTIILAAGGKESQKVLQEVGRGHRITERKKKFKVIDFFNPSNTYLVNHFGKRLCIYLQEKWEFVYE